MRHKKRMIKIKGGKIIFPPTRYGGDGGNRTHVRKHETEDRYVCSQSLVFTSSTRQTGILLAKPAMIRLFSPGERIG